MLNSWLCSTYQVCSAERQTFFEGVLGGWRAERGDLGWGVSSMSDAWRSQFKYYKYNAGQSLLPYNMLARFPRSYLYNMLARSPRTLSGESTYWLGCSWTNTACPRCFKYYKYTFWRSLLPHNMLACSRILISRPRGKCGSDPSRKSMCAINLHPTSSALVPIAPYKGLQGCLRPAACLTLSRAKNDHRTIICAVVLFERE